MGRQIDLSVVVTVHSETCVAGPTMRAADAAVVRAEAAGYAVERIIAYDHPTTGARAFFDQPALDVWCRVDVNGGDPGATRNQVVADHATGAAIAFLDADDLFSRHWLQRGMERLSRARSEGRARAIIHPELNWLFDGAGSVYWNPDQDDPLFASEYLYVMNPYDSLCLAPREACLEHPYVTRDIPDGLSFQDWHFAIETMAAGWHHLAAPDTIIFKRRRDVSLVTESRQRQAIVRALDGMRIDRIAGLKSASGAPDPRPLRARVTHRLRGKPGPGRDLAPLSAAQALDRLAALAARAEREEPHYGAVMQARITRGKTRAAAATPETVKADVTADDLDRVRAGFDMAYYLASYPDITDAERVDPVGHYLRVGLREGRNPSPLFDTRAWAAAHPVPGDVRSDAPRPPFARWLEAITAGGDAPHGRTGRPFAEMPRLAALLGQPVDTVEALWRGRYVTLRERLTFGALGAEVRAAAAFEPLVSGIWPEALQIKIPILHSLPIMTRLDVMAGAQAGAQGRPARMVILVNRPRWGGARRMEGHLADVLVDRVGTRELIVVSTDRSGAMPEGRLPEGVRHVDFAALSEDLAPVPRQRALVEFLRSLTPEAVFNVNSRLFWDALDRFGPALSQSSALYGCLLCNEQNRLGHWTGYPLRRFYRTFDRLRGVLTDSAFLADGLRRDYMLPRADAARVTVLPCPVNPEGPQVPTGSTAPALVRDGTARPRIFWTGRFDPQKRVDLVYRIAEALPEAVFRLWGEAVRGNPHALPPRPDNVTLEGRYDRFGDLPLGAADMWLYTSAWDGVPQMLLEVGMTGLPVVATDVGGTSEVLAPQGTACAILVPEAAGAQAYADALRATFADLPAARARAADLRAQLLAQRTPEAHAAALNGLLDATLVVADTQETLPGSRP